MGGGKGKKKRKKASMRTNGNSSLKKTDRADGEREREGGPRVRVCGGRQRAGGEQWGVWPGVLGRAGPARGEVF